MKSARQICSVDTPSTPGVDVRCKIGDQIYALEHTTLDPYPDARADNQRFLDVLKPLAISIEETGLLSFDYRYKLVVDIHAFGQISKSNFAKTRDQMKAWVIDNLDGLTPPRRGRAAVRCGGPPDLPVSANLYCSNASGVMRGKISLSRKAPANLEELRRQRVHQMVSAKGPKLHAEHNSGATAVLVLEDWDIAISNEVLIADAVHGELDASRYCIDDVYLVDTESTTEWNVFLLKRGELQWPSDDNGPPRWTFVPDDLRNLTIRDDSRA